MGNESSKTESDDKQARAVASIGIGAGLIVLSAFCPTAGVIVSEKSAEVGCVTKIIGQLIDNEEMKKVGETIEDGGTLGGLGSRVSEFAQGKGHACSICKVKKKQK
ncbi:hypothetical protein RclHR1_05660011 [Rhizophagus clarus]|uniref:Uncharacterized protein n=1 Tax=Rhizophagus clarus TaxID=94130 RepID=A0A2Z6RNN0_9GLOM|nr:hypothetical protein RclHR1_05660011 [Rhizophagus clarus]